MRHKYPRREPPPEKIPEEFSPYVGVAVLAVLLLGAAIIYPLGLRRYRLEIECATWPAAMGAIEIYRLSEAGGKGRSGPRVEVSYLYTVNGRQYRGSDWQLGSGPVSSEVYNRVLDCFKSGMPCDVYYRPDDPSVAVLTRSDPERNRAVYWIACGSIHAVAVFVVAWLTRREFRRRYEEWQARHLLEGMKVGPERVITYDDYPT